MIDQVCTGKCTAQSVRVFHIAGDGLHIEPSQRPPVMVNQNADRLPAAEQSPHQVRAHVAGRAGD